MAYEYIQKPTLNVQRALEQFGGWHRMFARSVETREREDTLVTEHDPRFWDMVAVTKMEEQLRKEVDVCITEYRKSYRWDRRTKKELEKAFAKALLESDWEADLDVIKTEIKKLQKERKEELKWLRQSIKRQRRK